MSVERRFSLIRHEHSEYLTTASAASTYLPLSGGSLTGAITLTLAGSHITLYDSDAADPQDRALIENNSALNIYTHDYSTGTWHHHIQGIPSNGDLYVGYNAGSGYTYLGNLSYQSYMYGPLNVTNWVSGHATQAYCRLFANGGAVLGGYVYMDGSSFGLLHSAGGWAVRVTTALTEITNPLNLQSQTTATTASAGARTLPSNPIDFLVVVINGVSRKIPYYAT